MEPTLFLAKVFGVYFVVTGLSMALRRKELSTLFAAFAEDRPLLYLTSVVALILGLVLVASHNVWTGGWPLVITLLSWLMLVKATLYLLLPFDWTARLIALVNRPAWFALGGPIAAGLGLILAGKGFQVI